MKTTPTTGGDMTPTTPLPALGAESLPVVACLLLDQHCRAVDDCEDYERIEIWNDENSGEYLRYEAAGRLDRLVRQSDAQSTITALREEVERLTREREKTTFALGGWKNMLWAVARELNCLPSTFWDGNGHVFKAAVKLNAELAALKTAHEAVLAQGVTLAHAALDQIDQARDAVRWRWLRDEAIWRAGPDGRGEMLWAVVGTRHDDCTPIDGAQLDAAVDDRIDAAMAFGKKQGEQT